MASALAYMPQRSLQVRTDCLRFPGSGRLWLLEQGDWARGLTLSAVVWTCPGGPSLLRTFRVFQSLSTQARPGLCSERIVQGMNAQSGTSGWHSEDLANLPQVRKLLEKLF